MLRRIEHLPEPLRTPASATERIGNTTQQDHLIRTDFVHTTDPSQADILWCKATLDGRTLAALGAPAEAGMNQFPREECLVRRGSVRLSLITRFNMCACRCSQKMQTVGIHCFKRPGAVISSSLSLSQVFKHLLARTAAACPGSGAWLPETFDMDRHAQAMVGAHFEALAADAGKPPLWCAAVCAPRVQAHRLSSALHPPPLCCSRATPDSHSRPRCPRPHKSDRRIVKPWNLGRSLDTVVTRSLSQVAAACVAGPKICQRYIADPLLVGGRKFDLRFLLLVESFSPVKARISEGAAAAWER